MAAATMSFSATTRSGPYVSAYHCSAPRGPPLSGSASWAKYGSARPSWLPCVQSVGSVAKISGEASKRASQSGWLVPSATASPVRSMKSAPSPSARRATAAHCAGFVRESPATMARTSEGPDGAVTKCHTAERPPAAAPPTS